MATTPIFEKFFSKEHGKLQTHVPVSDRKVHHAEFTVYRKGPVIVHKIMGATKSNPNVFATFDIQSELTDLNGNPMYEPDRVTWRQFIKGKPTDSNRILHTKLWEWVVAQNSTEWVPGDAWAKQAHCLTAVRALRREVLGPQH